jgi:hypothetical protein
MSSSRSQNQPRRVIAEFPGKSSPLFLVETEDEADGPQHFLITDADGGSPLALAELDHIDHDAGEADLSLEIGTELSDTAYHLTVSDMREALRAMLQASGVETAHFAKTNLSHDSLGRIGSHAANNVVEFRLPEDAGANEAIAA